MSLGLHSSAGYLWRTRGLAAYGHTSGDFILAPRRGQGQSDGPSLTQLRYTTQKRGRVVSQNSGYLFGGTYRQDYNIWGSTLGFSKRLDKVDINYSQLDLRAGFPKS